ncbi:MAG: hypothetical protein U1E65_10420 [Myxococcota bacterium]
MSTTIRPPSVPPGIWSAASALDSKLADGPVEPTDRGVYSGLLESWSRLSKSEQLIAWEELSDLGFHALADSVGHGLPFDWYLEARRSEDYDLTESELWRWLKEP